jgi:hypothetical protein
MMYCHAALSLNCYYQSTTANGRAQCQLANIVVSALQLIAPNAKEAC